MCVFFFKQKTAYEMRISDWSSDVCSSDLGIGEIGARINGTYSRSEYYRAATNLFQRRSSATKPFNTPGLLLPNILQNFPEQGYIERHQVNGALQWRASPSLKAYVEGFYTYFRDRGSHVGANIKPFTTGTTIVDGSVKISDRSEEHTSELQSLIRIS